MRLFGGMLLFQSTRPYGARPYGESLIATLSQFQSTRPYGARRVLAAEAGIDLCFNPRARMGRDDCVFHVLRIFVVVSIHAPVWGATPATTIAVRDCRVSIHAPVWGATSESVTGAV